MRHTMRLLIAVLWLAACCCHALLVSVPGTSATELENIAVVSLKGKDIPLLLTEDNAGVVADAFAVSGRSRTVLMSSCTLKPENAQAWLFLQNLYTQLAVVGLDKNLMMMCNNVATCPLAWERGYPTIMINWVWWNEHNNKRQEPAPLNHKWLAAYYLLKTDFSIFYIDWDVAIFAPFLHLLDSSDHDIIGLTDHHAYQLLHHRHSSPSCGVRYPKTGPCMSSGVFHIKVSPLAADFVMAVWHKSRGPPHVWEQNAFNELMALYALPVPYGGPKQTLVVRLFPLPSIINVHLLQSMIAAEGSHHLRNLSVLHCGYVFGAEKLRITKEGYPRLGNLNFTRSPWTPIWGNNLRTKPMNITRPTIPYHDIYPHNATRL